MECFYTSVKDLSSPMLIFLMNLAKESVQPIMNISPLQLTHNGLYSASLLIKSNPVSSKILSCTLSYYALQ